MQKKKRKKKKKKKISCRRDNTRDIIRNRAQEWGSRKSGAKGVGHDCAATSALVGISGLASY